MSRTEFWIDVGGTFTDCFARRPDGSLRRLKILSSGVFKGEAILTGGVLIDRARHRDPDDFWRGYTIRLLDEHGHVFFTGLVARFVAAEGALHLNYAPPTDSGTTVRYELDGGDESPLLAIRYLLGLKPEETPPPVVVRLGTTRGTNALLTRRGARTALITTCGFGDALAIGYQNRPRLFDLVIRKPLPLYTHVVEVKERVAVDGSVLLSLDEQMLADQLCALSGQKVESLAVCLLHATRNPEHELVVERVARACGFQQISLSHQTATIAKYVPRGDTTVVDAYLSPLLDKYIARLSHDLPGSDVRLLTSAGGLVAGTEFRGRDSILSGPAGGVVGYSRVAAAVGFTQSLGFDMGGTSTDVSRFSGRFELEYEYEKAGVRIAAPTMAIETVAAGGGSVCYHDGVRLRVGPQSAGAQPGPACYGHGGPLTVTDLNLLLGRILPERFPFPLDLAAVESRLDELIAKLRVQGTEYTREQLALGLLTIANATMVGALRKISIARGFDPRQFVLVPFGGAAGQHACAIARELNIITIVNHPDAGLLSAYGVGTADHVRHAARPVGQPLKDVLPRLEEPFAALSKQLTAELAIETDADSHVQFTRRLDLRYLGTDASLTIDESLGGDWAAAFEQAHRQLYGYVQTKSLEVVTVRLEGRVVDRRNPILPAVRAAKTSTAKPRELRQAWFGDSPVTTAVYDRDHLVFGDVVIGPAIVAEPFATTVVDPGWQGEVLSGGELLLTARETAEPQAKLSSQTSLDPVLLEVLNNHFAGIAEQMGETLRSTAASVNVKERLDFSCAVFDATGKLVANAPHVPVHLGAMGQTVRSLLEDYPAMQRGDVFISNDPYRGGSHLPDVTVVTPVFLATGTKKFFVASRAHHAEIGGIVPGSMPPFSRSLAEEGVLLSNLKLFDAGQARWDAIEAELRGGKYPSRSVADNLADMAAQVAANRQGERQLIELVERYGELLTGQSMLVIRAAAAAKTRAAIVTKIPAGVHQFVDHLDDGSPIVATCTRAVDTNADKLLTIDFTGTGPELPSNLNANRAIVGAAAMYVLRLLIDEDIPLNEGVLEPVELLLPRCLLNPEPGATPELSPAIAGGNVETSQRVVDVLLGALGLAAASQGTMNNLLLGDATFGYYETICGGSGATAIADGADAVHTHMTNTRLTDPEVLEWRYPLRAVEFSIRRGSGGAGRHSGGCGVVRTLEFLCPLTITLLTQRRDAYPPYGVNGGQSGAVGRNLLTRAGGKTEVLAGVAQLEVAPGDVLSIETPGGGGWGKK